jgi:N-formylglutamate amidohydrolase
MIDRAGACFTVAIFLGMVALFGPPSPAVQAQEKNQLITFQAGDLPIILTAPHGGKMPIPGVLPRTGKGVELFRATADSNTAKLTENLADAIEAKVGKRPFVIIALFHRKYLDANRRPRDAFESEDAEVFHTAYHKAISDARSEVARRWGQGLLLDIHGQAAEPMTIFRGTQNGKTATHLINRFGRGALEGESSLFGLIARQEIQVVPAVGSAAKEHADYDGGYTVITHGSGSGSTIDAIQLELGSELRAPKASKEVADKLADAIDEFSKQYLPAY